MPDNEMKTQIDEMSDSEIRTLFWYSVGYIQEALKISNPELLNECYEAYVQHEKMLKRYQHKTKP